MRIGFALIFMALIIALARCAVIAFRSGKSVGYSLGQLLTLLIPPVFGNLVILLAQVKSVAVVGAYIYFIGMDCVIFALLCFAINYCGYKRPGKRVTVPVGVLLISDIVQLLLNPVFHNAFDMEPVDFQGSIYYTVVPFLGQTYHRVVCYGLFFSVLIIFIIKMVNAPGIYRERYSVILLSMVLTGMWETFYIFSRTPVDRSMIGFGAFGLLVFYFSLYYRYTRLLDNMLANMASSMKEAIFMFNVGGQCIWANVPALELTGIRDEDYEQAGVALDTLLGGGLAHGAWQAEKQVVSGNGEKRYFVLEEKEVTDKKGDVTGTFLSVRDITSKQQELQRQKYNATHDPLTGLYSKEHLLELIRAALAQNPEGNYYIIFIDIMNFKIVNDIFGIAFGDQTLRMVANRIRMYAPSSALYGYLNADHFGMLVPAEDYDEETLAMIAGRITLSDGTKEFEIMVHAGVNEVKDKEIEIPVLFDWAQIALESIHKDFNTAVAYYSDRMREKGVWDQYITSQLTRAIEEKQIRMYLQPIVGASGKTEGCEALVRWIHPEHGFLYPASFIPVFEKNGRIADIDRYMWRCACETLARWKKEGRREFISVNISPNDFYFMDVAAQIRSLVREYRIEPDRLRLEITETSMMADQENRISMLKSLKESGFVIEMDDFGSGYSSFSMLKEMPVDVIKIDMRFLKQTGDSHKTDVIIRNIVRMSDELGIVSLTEGVETEEQFRTLTAMGCRLVQGFYFAKPLPEKEFEENWLAVG